MLLHVVCCREADRSFRKGLSHSTYRVCLTQVTTIKVQGEEGNACPQGDLPIDLVDERLFLR
jgi:hypothetical protein